MLRVAARRLAALSCFPWESSRAAVVSSSAFSSNGTGAYEYRSTFFSDSFNLGPHFYLHHRGFASDVVSKDEHTLIPEVPATAAAIKNLASKITYDEYNHERYPLGDPSKRAFAYFVLTGGRFVYASLVRLLILKFVLSMTATKDVLPLASIEVDLSNIEPGTIVVVKWHESLSSSSTELERKLKRQRKLTSQPFVTHRRMKKESKTLNGLSWSVPALILVVFHCQTLGTLGGGFALVMALTMMSLAEFVRDQRLIISKYLLTLSSMTTNC